MMAGIFLFNSCKKDTIQQGNQNSPGSSQNVKELVIKNLSWSYDGAGKEAFVNVTVPSNYLVDSILNVYRRFSFFNEWVEVSRDGTETDHLYYTILNGKLLLYYIFEINDPNTDIQYLLMNLNGNYNTIKVHFI